MVDRIKCFSEIKEDSTGIFVNLNYFWILSVISSKACSVEWLARKPN